MTHLPCDINWCATLLVPLRDECQDLALAEIRARLLEQSRNVSDFSGEHDWKQTSAIEEIFLAKQNPPLNLLLFCHFI